MPGNCCKRIASLVCMFAKASQRFTVKKLKSLGSCLICSLAWDGVLFIREGPFAEAVIKLRLLIPEHYPTVELPVRPRLFSFCSFLNREWCCSPPSCILWWSQAQGNLNSHRTTRPGDHTWTVFGICFHWRGNYR